MEKITRIIGGVEFVAEWKGVAFCNECIDKCTVKGTDRLSMTKLIEITLNELVISPKINIDDIPDMQLLNEIANFGQDILFGTYEKEKSKSQLKREVEEEWAYWRLVLSESGFDFPCVFGKQIMSPRDIEKANIALDKKIDAEKKALKKKH